MAFSFLRTSTAPSRRGRRPSPRATARYTFTPRPAGFRWYHTHTMAMNDFTRAQYSGQHGFLMIEPRENPGALRSGVLSRAA